MVRLIRPDEMYYEAYKDMMDEWQMEGSRIAPWTLQLPYHTRPLFEQMLKRVRAVERGENIGDYAPSTTFWLCDDARGRLLGASNLRHYLTEEGAKYWGHIGYGIRPSERRKGYAQTLLRLTLEEAAGMGISDALLGAYEGNVGSWRTMEKCGGRYERTVIEEESGLPVRRYWISTTQR